jgi:hypothetical protein
MSYRDSLILAAKSRDALILSAKSCHFYAQCPYPCCNANKCILQKEKNASDHFESAVKSMAQKMLDFSIICEDDQKLTFEQKESFSEITQILYEVIGKHDADRTQMLEDFENFNLSKNSIDTI